MQDCSREVRELSHRLEIAEKDAAALSCLCLAKRDLNPAEDPQGAATTGWVSGAAFEAEWHAMAISRP